jgi:hypothetical protein
MSYAAGLPPAARPKAVIIPYNIHQEDLFMTALSRLRPLTRLAGFGMLALTLVAVNASPAQTGSTREEAAKPPQFTEEKIAIIEENLVKDLESKNPGVVIGGTQTVREMKKAVPTHDFSKLIIPLMRIVKDENSDRASRILAALALDEIDSERGNFAISREGEMSNDDVFKSLCANLTKAKEAKKPK